MDSDLRYKWLEQRVLTSLQPKREALQSLIENEDNKLVILEFLNNEDIKYIYIYAKSPIQMVASNSGTSNLNEKGIYFLKTSNATKLSPDNMNDHVSIFESSARVFNHIDLLTRELFMPIMCIDQTSYEQSDKLMDVMHRIMAQVTVTQSQIEDSVSLPLPAFSILATAASNQNRRPAVLHVLETTIINWQKQIKNLLKQEPEIARIKSNFYTKEEIQLWTTRINKLNNLMVQLDAAYVKDILMNLENNNSAYVQSFTNIKEEIEAAVQSAEINLRFISTLTPWIYKIIKLQNIDDTQYLFLGLLQTVLLIWQNSKYYHTKDKFAHMLSFLSNEIVSISKEIVGDKMLEDPYSSFGKLKDALKICAMFRGTYLDFKEKADQLNAKYYIPEKKIDFNDKMIWWVHLYNKDDPYNRKKEEYDEFEIMRQNSPWPQRNHKCFYNLNVFMERCNDVLELVQTMRHFQILSKTVSIGGADNQSMDVIAQEVHSKYQNALYEFQRNVKDVMSLDKAEKFETCFFHLRTTIKELERELSQILQQSIKNCPTISAKLRLLEVFEGIHERDVIQEHLRKEHTWIIDELFKEFANVRTLCNSNDNSHRFFPSIISKLMWYNALEQRIKLPMEKLSHLCPNLLIGDVGWRLRDTYRQTLDLILKLKDESFNSWKASITTTLTDKLQQTILRNVSIEEYFMKRPTALEVNLDFELERLLKEIHYMRMTPLNMDLNGILNETFINLKDNNQLRLFTTRLRAIVDKYNLIMRNIQKEEKVLFESKLVKIDEIIEKGLTEYTWNSVEIPDYIEQAYSTICIDVYQNLDLIQSNFKDIHQISIEWSTCELDTFETRDKTKSYSSKELETIQNALHESFENRINREGKKIHSLMVNSFNAAGISQASPAWQDYINYINDIILRGFKLSSLKSLKNAYRAMVSNEELKVPYICINLELVENNLNFYPPLDENTHIKNLQEILFDWINMFISRGSYMQTIGKNRANYDQIVAQDEEIFEVVNSINNSIEKTCAECKQILQYINVYSFLWTVDINESFQEFLKGNISISRQKTGRTQSRNFMSDGGITKSITSLGSMLTPDVINGVERTFLTHSNKKLKDMNNTPLLEDFDAEIQIYVAARMEIKNIQSFQDIAWVRVNLEPTIQVLVTLTNKWVWTFTSYLANQIKSTLVELDSFLKRMEPEIEKITGDERDTTTFMKIMRMFNEVSSKQQEMEIKFELMKKTLSLLKKYDEHEVTELENRFNGTPLRWTNLKSKVTQAKQRLGPTIQEEFKVITQDLKAFAEIIMELHREINDSCLFQRGTSYDQAYDIMEAFFDRYNGLQNQAEDLKQLQELLESNVVDFSLLSKSKNILYNLKQLWRLVRELRKKHEDWKSVRWQKINVKLINEQIENQQSLLNNLPSETQSWDISLGIRQDILDIKACLPIIEDLANPAMRTRHWKQLVRVAGQTALVDNETLKTLTFGQLLKLNLQSHSEDVKNIVNKAVKDLSIEQTLKTYEEIWLSKVFEFEMYMDHRSDTAKSNDDEDRSSHDRRSSHSRAGLLQNIGATKSTKRLSIGSLPQSLAAVEPIQENEPIYLFNQAESIFAELEHHQIVLESLLLNQSAGSFYDEIIKWQNTLQNVEQVLYEWNLVQINWRRLESIYSTHEIHTILPQDSANFYKTDKDFRILMKATKKNNNVLKCCQRKNILSILKHLNQTLNSCYKSLLQEISKKRTVCPKLYLLTDDDMLEVLCCGNNLDRLSKMLNKVFNNIEGLKFDSESSEKTIIGCYGRNKEYFALAKPLIFKGAIEELINDFQNSIRDSVKSLLGLAMEGKTPIVESIIKFAQPVEVAENKSQKKTAQSNKNLKVLKAISESNSLNQSFSLISWALQHISQVIELSLKISFSKRIESHLNDEFDLQNFGAELKKAIELFLNELNNYDHTRNANIPDTENAMQNSEIGKQDMLSPKHGILLKQQQYEQLKIIVKILIYYRDFINHIIKKKLNEQSYEWLVKFKYNFSMNQNRIPELSISSLDSSLSYGFDYVGSTSFDNFLLQSPKVEFTFSQLLKTVGNRIYSLVHGENGQETVRAFSESVGYFNSEFVCTENASHDILLNVCKAIVSSGTWITFVNIQNLSQNSMSILSDIFYQLNQNKDSITINRESYNLTNKMIPVYFATAHESDQLQLTKTKDPLKIKRIDHLFTKISKDLLDKFRIIGTSTPDYKQIMNSILIANGFKYYDVLSGQLYNLMYIFKNNLQSMQFSYNKQSHIDRSLLSLFIKNAGEVLHSIEFDENVKPTKIGGDIQLYKEKKALAIVLSNVLFPRLDNKNALMFNHCMKQVWEDVDVSYCHKLFFQNDAVTLNAPVIIEKDTAMQIDDKLPLVDLSDAVLVATNKLNLCPSILFQSKVISIVENLRRYKNLIIVGESATGKSTCLKTALTALHEMGESVINRQIYINSLKNEEIFGDIETNTSNINTFNTHKEGLISSVLKEFTNHDGFNVMSIIGECETKYAYLYEALYNNYSMFTGQNNEKIIYNGSQFKCVWETDQISNLSPSIITFSNLIFLNEPLMTWNSVVESTFQNYPDASGLYKSLYDEVKKYLEIIHNEFKVTQNVFKDVLPIKFESKVKFMMTILKATIKNNDHWNENDVIPIVEYSAINAIAASMTVSSRVAFNEWWRAKFPTYPTEASVYDYYYDIDGHQFQLWSDSIPTFSCPPHQGIPLNVFVHTPSTMFINSLLDITMNSDESIMIVGEAGNGKTSLIQDKLRASCSGDITEVFYITINTNRLTDGSYIHSRINHHLSWKHGSLYIPKGNKRMYCFIDDLHLAKLDDNNKQTALELLRQHLDSGYFYDFVNKRWQNVKNVTYITTFNPKVYSPSNSVSNKVLKHFHVIAQHFPSDSEIESIYTKLIYRHIFGDTDNESSAKEKTSLSMARMKNLQPLLKNMIQSSIDLINKMRSIFLEKSQRLHYVFTLQTLTSLFRHICVSIAPDCTKEQLLLLWRHECDWLYAKKLISHVDVERYQQAFKTVIKKNFSDQNSLSLLNKTVFFSNLKETESGIVVAGLNNINFLANNNKEFTTDGYEPEANMTRIRNLIQTSLNEYNKEQQKIQFPLYESTLTLVCRLCHTIPILGGNCCIIGDGGLSLFIIQLVASLTSYHIVHFKTSQFLYNEQVFFQQLKHKLISSYYRAGIRGEKVMLCLTEEEMKHKEFLVYVTEFVISEEIMHLFTIEEETTILNSIRTQVIQAGLTYSKETAWELFIKNIRENIRIVILLNENPSKFQILCSENPSLFNNMELIWIQHWNVKELVKNSYFHFNDIKWLDKSMAENVAYLLAFMHISIREHDEAKSLHLNNITFTKFVEKFKLLLNSKYNYIEISHKNVCRLLEHIQKQHSIAKKLMVQLEQENMVLEERIKSTDKMLQQIGQDMTMTEQQLKIHKTQTRKTVQLKRILPEYQTAHERNVYKTIAIVSNTKKLIQNINMQSLQELRSLQKPDVKVEEILASVIIILKSPISDLTWQKGAKRQMANLDRFLEELQSFDEHEITEDTIKLLEDRIKRIDLDEMKEETQSLNSQQFFYTEALNTLYNWIKGVIKYHSLMIKRVKPLHKKVQDIEHEVKEADQKLATLNRKSEALQARLKDLAQNFEEATVDKKEQEEKVNKMQHQLDTASELNKILSREFERNMQIYESLQERIFCLPGSCALAAGFLVYLGPYQFPFRRLMLTMHWIKCLRDRGLPLVLDSLSNINGRIVTWQMDSLLHLLSQSKDINIPNDDWKVHFASDQITNEPFIVPSKDAFSDESKLEAINTSEVKPKSNTIGTELVSNHMADEDLHPNLGPQSSLKSVKISENPKINDSMMDDNKDDENFDETILKNQSNPVSAISKFSEQSGFSGIVSGIDYKKFIIALTSFLVGEEQLTDWLTNDADALEIENSAIINNCKKHPPLIYEASNKLKKLIFSKNTNSIVNLEKKDNEDTVMIEKCFQTGSFIIFENCYDIDPVLLPLIYYKNSMNEIPTSEDSRLILFSNRRLFCNPSFQMFFSTKHQFETFSPNILCYTTPINFKPSIENLIESFQNSLFSSLFKNEYSKRNLLLEKIKECNQKLKEIDIVLKNKWEKDGFQDEEVLITKIALERKYRIGEILEYCQEFVNNINDLIKVIAPIAIRAGLLVMLSQKMTYLSKNYDFSRTTIENIFTGFEKVAKPVPQAFELRTELIDNQETYNFDDVNKNKLKMVESQLPKVTSIEDIRDSNYITYSPDNINELIKYLTNEFLNQIIISLSPDHRLHLLSLVCFYIQLEQKTEFTDIELEFLIRGNSDANINITLLDFGITKDTNQLSWIPKDSFNDLLALSLLQGDMDHFVLAVMSDEAEWKKWYHNPLKDVMPKIEMEMDNSDNTEMVELNEFRKLLVHRVLRPDTYASKLHSYVNQMLELKLSTWKWKDIFANDNYKSFIINMEKSSEISTMSTINRIHQHLNSLSKKYDAPITLLNCDNITATEYMNERENMKSGLLVLKNIHLANDEVLDCVRLTCLYLNENNESWKLIMTKSFDFILPFSTCLVLSYDTLDIIANNEKKKEKAKTLKTRNSSAENCIFKTIVDTLNLINEKTSDLSQEKHNLVYITCLAHGLLQGRQNLVCSGLQKSFPWSTSWILEVLSTIQDFNLDISLFPSTLLKNVYSQYLSDPFDQDYILQLLKILSNSLSKKEIQINGFSLPFPDSAIQPANYSSWFSENFADEEISTLVLQVHESMLNHHSTIKAEDFIEEFQMLWDASFNTQKQLENQLKPDLLYFSIKMCKEKLPPLLEIHSLIEPKPENFVEFALYEECVLYNEQFKIVTRHLNELQKYLLVETALFPHEWKKIAFCLQQQRIPEEWEIEKPVIHTLKSWISLQNVRYNQLCGWLQKDFKNINTINFCAIKQPQMLLNSILQQKCTRNRWMPDEAKLCFEIYQERQNNSITDGIVLYGMKLVGSVFDASTNSILPSEKLYNNLPSVLVHVTKTSNLENDSYNNELLAVNSKESSYMKLRIYTNILRQNYIISLPLHNNCGDKILPFIVLDVGYDDQSRRQQKPVISNLYSINQNSMLLADGTSIPASQINNILSAKATINKPNQTLAQIREASAERLPTPESQLSFKPATPLAPKLPSNLQLTRSRPMN